MDALSFFGLSCGNSAALLIGTAAMIPIMGAVLFFTSPKKKNASEISH